MAISKQSQHVELQDIFIPVQGGIVNDVVISIDPVGGLTNFANIVPVTNFAKFFLNNYPNPNDIYENVSKNLTAAIFNNAGILGLAGKTNSVSVEMMREPISILPYPFASKSTQNSTGNTEQLTELRLDNLLIPVQGGTIADVKISLDFADNVAAFPDINPLVNFSRSYLTTYGDPNAFYEKVSQNLAATIINNPGAFGLEGKLDSVSVQMERGPNAALPHPFVATSIGTPGVGLDQIVQIEIGDLFVPVQGGTVNDVVLTIDYANGLGTFPDITPATNFVKSFLSNYPNPNDFYENISKNLTAAMLNNAAGLGLSGNIDSISVELTRDPIAILPYNFASKNTITAAGNNEQIIKLKLEDLLIPVQGGTVADGTLTVDFVDNVEAFPNITALTNFVKDYLTNYPNPNDLYENISQNLASTAINNAKALGLEGIIDSISFDLRRSPNAVVPHAFTSSSTVIPLAPSNTALTTSESFEMFPQDFANEFALV